ncbi:D-amino-acid oxidase, partial [Colletotrichum sp. SAR 10_77]
MSNTIVVVGAGVIGLTSALLLAKEGNSVTVVGKHMPGDYDAEPLSYRNGSLSDHGVVVKRGNLKNINEAKFLSHKGRVANIIVNATGLGSLKLGGVEDSTMAPSRGQIVVVRNETPKNFPLLMCSSPLDGSGEEVYAMQRAAGGGTILGGTYDIGNWNSQPDPNTALRIMQRIVDLCPDIAGGKGIAGLDVIRHG